MTIPLHSLEFGDEPPWACMNRLPVNAVRFDLRCADCCTAAAGYLAAGYDPIKPFMGAGGVVKLPLSEALQFAQEHRDVE